MKKSVAVLSVTILGISTVGSAWAGSSTGVLSSVSSHYSSAYAICVEMSPALSAGSQYACVDPNANNAKQFVAMLLSARLAGNTVTIWWDYEANGVKVIAQMAL